MSKGNKHYVMLNEKDIVPHDHKKHGCFSEHNCTGRTLNAVEFVTVHGNRWKTVAHRMRTWYAAKFKQANKDKDAMAAYRYLDSHNAMLRMIQGNAY